MSDLRISAPRDLWDKARAQCVHDNVMQSAQEAVYVRPLTGPVEPSTDLGYLGCGF